jgi:glutathione synthase/RimK-type ligase-like ATP-grasp enzyme
VRGYIAEARQRAEDIGHTLTEQDEESLGADLQTAEDVDAGIITKQEAITTRPSRFIANYNP